MVNKAVEVDVSFKQLEVIGSSAPVRQGLQVRCVQRGFWVIVEDALRKRFNISKFDLHIEPRYNIAPSTKIVTIVQDEDNTRRATGMSWGLIPFWSKEPKTKYSTINVKAETITTNKIFKRAFEHRRCLVPVTGFYEWSGEKGNKTPYNIWLGKNTLFAFAGVYEIWESLDKKSKVESVAFATTSANDVMKPIHSRMPVILQPDDEDVWLHPDAEQENLLKILQPYSGEMEAYEVSQFVNKPENNGPECIRPVELW